jgi:rhodanese-related sulfurtransferase
LQQDAIPFIVDVREPAEIEKTGYIAGSVNIPIRDLLKNLDKLPAQDQKIVITCASGHRGGYGMVALRLLGYTNVVNLNGGVLMAGSRASSRLRPECPPKLLPVPLLKWMRPVLRRWMHT